MISSDDRQAGPFNCDGSDVTFEFTFKVFTAADVLVILTSAAGLESELVLNTDYTVALNADQDADPGGVITTVGASSPYATGNKITLTSQVAETQGTQLPSGGNWNAKVVEAALDKLTILFQQIKNALARSLKIPISDSASLNELPTAANRADKVLGFDSTGQVKVYDPASAVTSAENVNYTPPGSGLSTTTVEAQLQKSEFFDTIAALKLYSAPTSEVTAFVRGYYSAGDGGGGMFRWDSASTAADNGGTIIQATSVPIGRWERYNESQISFRVFGAKLDDATDDLAKIQAALDSVGDTTNVGRSGFKFVLDGPAAISGSIICRRKAIVIEAHGWGHRADTNPLRAYFRWIGAAGSPMLVVQDVRGFRLAGAVRFVGNSAAKPSAALNFNETNDGWPLTANVFDNVYIGAIPGETDDAEQFTDGVLIDGGNFNNSELKGKNLYVYKVARDGVHVGFIQNVNIKIDGYYNAFCGRAGLWNAGAVQIHQWSSAGNAADFFLPSTDDGGNIALSRTNVHGYLSELCGRMAEIAGSADFKIDGGTFSVSASLNADGKVIKADGTNTAIQLKLRDIGWLQASVPPAPAHLALAPGAAGQRHIIIEDTKGWGAVLTGGLYGMDVALGGANARAYVKFIENLGSTGLGFPVRVAENYVCGQAGQNWRPNSIDAPSVRYFDDFLGDSLNARWGSLAGTDPQCVLPAPLVGNPNANGICRMVTGDDAGGTMALNGAQLHSTINYTANSGPVIFELRIRASAITDLCLFFGFTDQIAALEMPFTLGAGDALTSNATDAVGWLFDTAADTDNWWLVGVANNVDAVKQNTGVAPVANTFEVLRVELAGATATFFRNGVNVGVAMAAAVSGAMLTPVIAAFSRGAATRNIDWDYTDEQSQRGYP